MARRRSENVPRSNAEWRAWGERDPLWGVAAWPGREKGGADPWTDDAFFALGSSDWRDFVARWRRYGLVADSVVELGCGAGRITRALAADFARVEAVDVSEGMLRYARERIGDRHVAFRLSDGRSLPLPDASVTAAFSCHVLQHLDPPSLVWHAFGEMARVLARGGTLMVHLPVYRTPRELSFSGLSEALLRGASLVWRARVALRRRLGRSAMSMTAVSMEDVFSRLPPLGLEDVELASFPAASNGDVHSFVLARRSGHVSR